MSVTDWMAGYVILCAAGLMLFPVLSSTRGRMRVAALACLVVVALGAVVVLVLPDNGQVSVVPGGRVVAPRAPVKSLTADA